MKNETLTLKTIGRNLIIESHDARSNIATIKRMIAAATLMAEEIVKITPLAEFEIFTSGYEIIRASLKNNADLNALREASLRVENEEYRAIKISGNSELVAVLSNPITIGLELLKHINQTSDRDVGWLSDQIIEMGSTIAIGREIIDKYAGNGSTALESKICEKIAQIV